MGKRAGYAIGLILIIFSFLLLPLALDSFDDARRSEQSNAATVVTAAGITTGNITLHYGLYNNSVNEVYNIISTDTDDVPLANTYATATKALNVSGLAANTTRTVTASYHTARDDYSIDDLLGITPFVIFALMLLSGVGVAFNSWRLS